VGTTPLCMLRVRVPRLAAAGRLRTSSLRAKSSVAKLANLTQDKFGTPFAVRSHAILPLSIIDHPHVRKALPFLGNVAYGILASGFLMTDILTLRGMLVFGYSGLVTFHILQPRPLRIPLRWSAVFVAANAVMAVRLALERWPIGMTEEDEALRAAHFHKLTAAQFKTLLDLGERRSFDNGARLTTRHVPCSRLYFVEQGTARLKCNGELVARIGRGGFINDVAFQQSEGTGRQAGAYGTVECDEQLRVISWDCAELRRHMEQQESLSSSMHQVLVSSLVEQMLQRYVEAERQQSAAGGKKLRSSQTEDQFRTKLEETRRRVQHTASGKELPRATPSGSGPPLSGSASAAEAHAAGAELVQPQGTHVANQRSTPSVCGG